MIKTKEFEVDFRNIPVELTGNSGSLELWQKNNPKVRIKSITPYQFKIVHSVTRYLVQYEEDDKEVK